MPRLLVACLILAPAPAHAHKLNLFAQVDGVTIAGRAYFPGDIAARQVEVIARDAAGGELGRAKTDDTGHFMLSAPIKTDYHLTAETADGHAANCIVATQIESTRAQIDQSEQRLRFRDVLGGIGFIVGLAGIGFYFKARQRRAT
jgi:nickel transport protein